MSNTPVIDLLRLPNFGDLPLPSYKSTGAAGMDIHAATDADVTVAAGGRATIPTGLAMAIPAGFEVQIRPRSGLAAKYGVTIANAPGTIDSDYRGEIQIILLNLGDTDFTVFRGMRVAQMVVAPVIQSEFRLSGSLNETGRGAGGFGSTGV